MKLHPTLVAILVLLTLMSACTADRPRPATEPAIPTDEQRAGAGPSRSLTAQITRAPEWADDCVQAMKASDDLEIMDDDVILSWRVTAAEVQGADAWQWRIGTSPDDAPSVLRNSEESVSWLCGPAGTYRLDLTARKDNVWYPYQMQVEVEQ